MPRDEERINFTITHELKSELLQIVQSHRRNLSQELKLLIECYVLIQKNNGVINPDLTISSSVKAQSHIPQNPSITDIQNWMDEQYAELKERINRELDAALPKETNTILQNGNDNNVVIGK